MAQVVCENHPSEETAVPNRPESGIMGGVRGIVHVIPTAHRRRPEEGGNQQDNIHVPSDLQLLPGQLHSFGVPQNKGQGDAHQINRQTVCWQDVHKIRGVEQLGHPVKVGEGKI